MRVLIVGYAQAGEMGCYLASAAKQLRLEYEIMDANEAETAIRFAQKFYWRFRGKRPVHLASFAAKVLAACATMKPSVVVTTGSRAPLERSHVAKLRDMGISVVNYSTDDPWNPVLHAPWFVSALPAYNAVFTPRRANSDDFQRCGVRNLHYLPFGYDPDIHRPWPADSPPGRASDLLFVGGCDAERLPLISAPIDAGLNVALFGRYWDRHFKTRAYWRGVANQDTIRAASATAAICLCLVRRANRDGHVMRSFEAAAIGGCLLVEDTPDHREFFGPDDVAVRYFKTKIDLATEARRLLDDSDARSRLAIALRERMASRNDTYADRLAVILRESKLSAVPA